jgi:DNA-binding NarL/FixJ family response regulator
MPATSTTSPSACRVFVASPCPAMLEGLAAIVRRRSQMQVVGQASERGAALRRAIELKPDVTVFDAQFNDSPASIFVQVVRDHVRGRPRIVILSDLQRHDDIVPALRCGAVGYIDRNSSAEEILRCIERVHAGHRHLAPDAAMRLALSVDLTSRERQVVELIGKHFANGEIASMLRISESMVRKHLSGLLMKLNARCRTEAIDVAIECGLLSAPTKAEGSASQSPAMN